MRINAVIGMITLAGLGLTFACSDDSSESNDGDGGLSSDSSSSENNTQAQGTSGNKTTASTTGSSDEECDEAISIVCEGDNRVRLDPCNQSGPQVLEQCAGACDQGRCVECAPRGVVCNAGDVYLIDSCGELGDKVHDCANGCALGECVAEECVASDDRQCIGDLLVSLNSCGDQVNIEAQCEDGCEDGACMGCVDEGATLCYEGNIYPVDSCGRTGAVLEQCDVSCSVASTGDTTAATCSDTVCEPTSNVECFKGDMYAVDSCGGITEDVVTDCHNGCDEGGCLPCVPAPVGVVCFQGDVYDTIGGCDEPTVRATTVKQVCEFGCVNGACTDQGECVPAGVICMGGNVHSIDSCAQVGDLLETCTAGCQQGACTNTADAGPESSDTGSGGTSGSGTSSTNSTGSSSNGVDSSGSNTTSNSASSETSDQSSADAGSSSTSGTSTDIESDTLDAGVSDESE